VRSATRREWPLVVGSRCSIASTLARTKPSSMRSDLVVEDAFSSAMPAWDASVMSSSSLRSSNGIT
jgi:hypothetical protein